MEDFLNQPKIDYVFEHLKFHCQINEELFKKIKFVKEKDFSGSEIESGKIYFLLSEKRLDFDIVKIIDNLPILFPIEDFERFFSFENNSLIFHNDVLKSAFYLLSGYQEFYHTKGDYYDRFPYEDSVQFKLNIIKKPIVNYYFDKIIEGFEKFASINNFEFRRMRLFNSFGFLLTHDIDFIDRYTLNNVMRQAIGLIGLKKSEYKKKSTQLRVFLKYLFNYLNFINRKNPDWNFKYLRELEKQYNYSSVFYFLHKDQKYKDSFYAFSEKRLVELFKWLISEGCEIGIHGTINSSKSLKAMNNIVAKLEQASGANIVGNRQHCLAYKFPTTADIHQQKGFLYDTTLGFAAHEGFRHSYCHPFKLYNFEEEKPYNYWEFPLNVMDATLFGYQKYNFDEASKSINEIIEEIKKFGGLFTLLWHNDFFDEELFNGITLFYENLLNDINFHKPENYTGEKIVRIINHI